ncbi:MAG: GAF domain-containing protein [Alphaproteobacteria bacterium]|nr:GAF domain-containing protein [Alphaproteobacteria bacterium]
MNRRHIEANAVELVQRLTRIGAALSSERDRDTLLEHILLAAKEITNSDGGTLYILSPEQDVLEYVIVRTDSLGISFGGTTGKKPPFHVIRLYDPVTGEPHMRTQVVKAVVTKESLNVHDVYASKDFDFAGTKQFDTKYGFRTKSVLTIPMINHRNEAIGCLQLINAKDPDTGATVIFSDEVCELVDALASQAAVIIDKETLIQDQKTLLESFIKMMASAIDAKSPYTGSHCVRVPVLTEMIAEAACNTSEGKFADFKMSDEEKYELHIAGWLHDAGKMVTPVHIMDKATKLETIFDRIHIVRARFEVLKRDAKIKLLEGTITKPQYDDEMRLLEDELNFIETSNIGGEFLEDEKIERQKKIGERIVNIGGQEHPLLTENELYNLSIRRGTITAEERQIMNDHMVHTVNMLESMPWPKHLKRVPEYACGHHEKMDGTGYPKGLLAGTMSLPARMMAIADVFEALTASDRPYKKPKTLSESMKIIGMFKKTNHLDPELVDFFVQSKVYRKFAEMFLNQEQIDEVDEEAILAIQPEPMVMRKAKAG